MPIYAYKCSSCGHTEDVLQKLSAAPLTNCPACGKATYSKQVTAPQFQLKGSGWYVTDFKGGNTSTKENKSSDEAKTAGITADSKPTEKSPAGSGTASVSPASPPAATPTPAATAAPTPAATKAAGE